MIKKRSLRFWGIVLVAAAAFAFAAAPRLVSQGYEKICPITFGLYPDTLLEKNYAAKIERDNAKLATFLGELRGAVYASEKAGLPFDPLKWFIKHKDAKGAVDPFAGTYLVIPSLTTEKGELVEGVPNVLTELTRIITTSTYIDAQSVHVYLEYLPYGSDAYKAQNPVGTPEEKIVDIIAHIKTVLAYAPHDAPVTIEGTEPHRKVCDPGR